MFPLPFSSPDFNCVSREHVLDPSPTHTTNLLELVLDFRETDVCDENMHKFSTSTRRTNCCTPSEFNFFTGPHSTFAELQGNLKTFDETFGFVQNIAEASLKSFTSRQDSQCVAGIARNFRKLSGDTVTEFH